MMQRILKYIKIFFDCNIKNFILLYVKERNFREIDYSVEIITFYIY